MMIFNLIKKDILIIKKYVLIMLAAAVLIPPFMLWRAPEYPGILGFMLSAIYCVLILLQYISLKEYQFPHAAALLCAAPFSRKMMVLSKYIFCISIYVICCVIYAAETLIIPGLGTTNMNVFSLMLLVTSVFIGIYLPVQYKLGYEKTKFTFFVLLMASPIILPWLIKVLSGVDLSFLTSYSPLLIFMAALAASCIILLLSVILSVKFYSDTDLA